MHEGAEQSDGLNGDAEFEAGDNEGLEAGGPAQEPFLDEKPKRVKRRSHPGESEDGDDIVYEGAAQLDVKGAKQGVDGSAKRKKAGSKGPKHEDGEDTQVAREHPANDSNFAPPEELDSRTRARGVKQEWGEEKPRIRREAEDLSTATPAAEKVRRKRKVEEEAGEVVLLSEAVGVKRKHGAEGEPAEQGGPSGSQKKVSKKRADPPAESRGAREGSPEPSFQGRDLRVAFPPRRQWPEEGDGKQAKPTPVSPTRAAAKRAAAETAAAAGGSRGGGEDTAAEKREAEEREVLDAVAQILREREVEWTSEVPLNKLSLQVSSILPFIAFQNQLQKTGS